MQAKISKKIERIAGLQKVSMIDWDGVVSSVIFLSGCNWNCPFCHNHELCRVNKNIDEDEIFTFLNNKKDWIDGVVLCGGEPLFNKDVFGFVERLKEKGINIKIDTNGSKPELLKSLVSDGLVDYVAMDIKARLTDAAYEKATEVAGQAGKVKESMEVLFNGNVDFELRTTLVPGIVNIEDIDFNLQFISVGTKYVLQQFVSDNVRDKSLKNIKIYSEKEITEMIERIRNKGVKACLRI